MHKPLGTLYVQITPWILKELSRQTNHSMDTQAHSVNT